MLGLWLILAPFIVGYSGSVGPLVNDIIVGAVVLIVDVWAAAVAGKEERTMTGFGHMIE